MKFSEELSSTFYVYDYLNLKLHFLLFNLLAYSWENADPQCY